MSFGSLSDGELEARTLALLLDIGVEVAGSLLLMPPTEEPANTEPEPVAIPSLDNG